MSRARQIEHDPQTAARQRGFALLVVLSALGLLAVVAAGFLQIARSHVRSAHAAVESARAEALADAGVQIAILDLVGARESQPSSRRLSLDATPLFCSMGTEGATLTLAIQDEAGKVDLNIGTEPLLRALVTGLGIQAADAKVDAILDFRDEDDDRRLDGAERAEYKAAGRPHGPRNGPFLAMEDITSVLGISQADADLLKPFVTIYSGLPAIDANVAPQALIQIIGRGSDRVGGARPFGQMAMTEIGRPGAPLPAQYQAASTRRAFSVHSQAHLPTGARFVREVVVEFVTTSPAVFVLRRWYRGNAVLGPAPSAEQLPPC